MLFLIIVKANFEIASFIIKFLNFPGKYLLICYFCMILY